MKELNFDSDDIMDLERESLSRDSDLPEACDRFRVTVDLVVKADSSDEAEDEVRTMLDLGINTLEENEDRRPVRSWTIIDSIPEEV